LITAIITIITITIIILEEKVTYSKDSTPVRSKQSTDITTAVVLVIIIIITTTVATIME